MAHARRKFFDLYENSKSAMAQKALQYIQELYKIERQAQCLTVKERRRLRQSRGKPKADEFHEWLIEHRTRIADNSARAKAMDYSIKRW